MDSRYISKPYLAEFLTLYKEQTCLWKSDSEHFNNRIHRKKAFKKLIEKFKEVEPGADKEMVVKKLSSFRNSFRRELKKMAEDESYTPKLWYFKNLMFLKGNELEDSTEIHSSLNKNEVIIEDNNVIESNDEVRNLLCEKEEKIGAIGDEVMSKLRKLPSEKISLVHGLLMHVLYEAENGNVSPATRISLFEQIGANYINKR